MSEFVRILENKIVKTRKIHKCHNCNNEIPKGEKAYFQKYVDDDSIVPIDKFYLHEACYKHMKKQESHYGDSCLKCVLFCADGECMSDCIPDYDY